MKKITLLFISLLVFQLGNAQQTISFETSEGYTAGNINTQNGWTTTGSGPGTFVENQVVSSESATTGTNSLKLTQETAFPGQSSPIVGAFYNYATPVPNTAAVFSADYFISQQDADSSNFIFGLVNLTAGVFVARFEFDFQGNIFVLDLDGTGQVVRLDTATAWSANTWYNIRMEISGTTITYFVDNVQIHQGQLTSNNAIEQVRFSHDNFEGFAYVDNFRTNDEPTAGVDEFDTDVFSHFYDKNSDILTLESSMSSLSNVQMYNILGQEVLNKGLSQPREALNLSGFEDGVYIVRATINDQTTSFKFLKQ